jgi:hypothetical protein
VELPKKGSTYGHVVKLTTQLHVLGVAKNSWSYISSPHPHGGVLTAVHLPLHFIMIQIYGCFSLLNDCVSPSAAIAQPIRWLATDKHRCSVAGKVGMFCLTTASILVVGTEHAVSSRIPLAVSVRMEVGAEA